MKNIIKLSLVYLSTFIILILIMIASFLIPQKNIKNNTIKSIKYCHNHLIETNMFKNYPKYLKIDTGDLRYMEMVYLVDNDHPIKSLIEMNSYISGNYNELEKGNFNYSQYARYWHGSVLYLRLIMLFTDYKGLIIIEKIVLLLITLLMFYILFKNNKVMLLTSIIVFYMFSIDKITISIPYYNCIIISLIASITIYLFIHLKKEKYIQYVFLITGLFTNFFDFYTLYNLTLTIPLIFLIIFNKKENIKNKQIIKYIIIWTIAYIIPYIIKWIIIYFYYGNKGIEEIKNLALTEGNNPLFNINYLKIFNKNIKLMLPFYYMSNYIYIVIIIITLFLYNFIYYTDNNKKITITIIFILVLLRIILVPIQAYNLTFTTFRELLPIFLVMIYINLKQICNVINNLKNVIKEN